MNGSTEIDVSVVVPCHDDGQFLGDAVASICAQGGLAWECIIVDDASSDDTPEIARDLTTNDPRFRFVEHPVNRGLAATRNTGIELARGEAVAFLDADDFLVGPRSLADRWVLLRRSAPEVAGVYCDWAPVTEDASIESWKQADKAFGGLGDRWPTVDYTTGLGANLFIATAPLVRTEPLRALGGFSERLRSAEDFELWTRIMRHGGRFVYSGTRGVAYRQRQGSMVHLDALGHAENAMSVIEAMRKPLDRSTEVRFGNAEPYWDPVPEVPLESRVAERLLVFSTYAVLAGDRAQMEGMRQLIATECLRPAVWETTLDRAISASCARLQVRGIDVADRERQRVQHLLRDWIAPAP